jgi:8-amino-7-oxononanoate synthase
VLIVIEGIYSMDGDFPDLPCFIKIKNKYSTFLMVDEAHSLGVLGGTGKGLAEHFNACTSDVDIWMGTLSKTLAGCGGYITGCAALIENLRYKAPGFLYSVGMSCPMAAASLTALKIMLAEPDRVRRLQEKSKEFLDKAISFNMKVDNSKGYGVIIVLVGHSRSAVTLSNALLENNINVQPVIYPAVEPNKARLRFFINCEHTSEQIDQTLSVLSRLL